MVGQPFAQADLEHLLHPGLPDHERQQDADDGEEDQQLMRQAPAGSAALSGVEEGAMPLVEPDLADHVADQHQRRCRRPAGRFGAARPTARARAAGRGSREAALLAFVGRGRRPELAAATLAGRIGPSPHRLPRGASSACGRNAACSRARHRSVLLARCLSHRCWLPHQTSTALYSIYNVPMMSASNTKNCKQ